MGYEWRWCSYNFGCRTLAQMDFLRSRRFIIIASYDVWNTSCVVFRNKPRQSLRFSVRSYFRIPLAVSPIRLDTRKLVSPLARLLYRHNQRSPLPGCQRQSTQEHSQTLGDPFECELRRFPRTTRQPENSRGLA